jgi:hypothetical protein
MRYCLPSWRISKSQRYHPERTKLTLRRLSKQKLDDSYNRDLCYALVRRSHRWWRK